MNKEHKILWIMWTWYNIFVITSFWTGITWLKVEDKLTKDLCSMRDECQNEQLMMILEQRKEWLRNAARIYLNHLDDINSSKSTHSQVIKTKCKHEGVMSPQLMLSLTKIKWSEFKCSKDIRLKIPHPTFPMSPSWMVQIHKKLSVIFTAVAADCPTPNKNDSLIRL